ncbi:hypothetical protein EBU71_22455, partial [bacterium]|nr:hypothetical protein [Candidatus Elulimicrobium humile]
MADVTISQLTQGIPSNNALIPFSQGGNTFSVAPSALLINSGNIGIGTSSPQYKLDILDNSNVAGIRISGSADNIALNLNNTQSGGKSFRIISTATGSGYGSGSLAFEDQALGAVLNIRNTGAVTKPFQPAFAVGAINKAYIGPNPKLNSFELLQNINVGNGFNINSGIFTAPAGGIYSISGMIRLDPGPSTYIYPNFYINDTIYWDIAGDTTQPLPGLSISNNVNGFSTANFSLLIKLNQGDTLQFGYSTPGNAQT